MKRQVSLKALGYGKVEEASKGTVRQTVTLNVGISTDKAKEIGKFIKELGLKGVSHQIQGDQLRVSGKKTRRPAVGDRGDEGPRLRRPPAVHQLQGLTRPSLPDAWVSRLCRARTCAAYGDAPRPRRAVGVGGHGCWP